MGRKKFKNPKNLNQAARQKAVLQKIAANKQTLKELNARIKTRREEAERKEAALQEAALQEATLQEATLQEDREQAINKKKEKKEKEKKEREMTYQQLAAKSALPQRKIKKRKVTSDRFDPSSEEKRAIRKKEIEDFFKNHGGTLFWMMFIASTTGILSYENNYPTTRSVPKTLKIVMDIVFISMLIMLLYVFNKYWKRYNSSNASKSKKHIVLGYSTMFFIGTGFWSYYHFSLVPKARVNERHVKPLYSFLHKISILMVYVSLFTLQALTIN